MRKIIPLLLFVVCFSACQQDLPTSEETDDKPFVKHSYQVYPLSIQVENGASVVSKDPADYLNCSITVDGLDIFDDYTGAGQIRGRGNSSWLWYDKKPYRIKLGETSKLLGLKKNRDWVLLANYRDPTKLMNTFGFEVADWLGLPYPNHTRYVELTLNGSYVGLYQLTEQVEQGGNRVAVDSTGGWLLCLDADDGPYYSPETKDNFWSSLYELPICVKYPDLPSVDLLYSIKADFAKLENAVQAYDYDGVDSLLDIPAFINYLILQELVYNVEIDAPRSVFLYKNPGGKYVFGPAWDFDAGFDFDWGTMYTGHNYFNAQELVLGTDPANHTGGYRISDFFTQMFRNGRFVQEYKDRWNQVKDSIVEQAWLKMLEYRDALQDALAKDAQRWPIDKNYNTEIGRMEDWLTQRVSRLNTVINNYPSGSVQTTKIDVGSLICDTVKLSYQAGYHQTVTVNINEADLLLKLGITRELLYGSGLKIMPLKTDGTEGSNNTNGLYGAWFEADNNPGYWANGHVFIEINQNLTTWTCGLRAGEGFCSVGDKHAVRMQYQFTQGTQTKTVTVTVPFKIEG